MNKTTNNQEFFVSYRIYYEDTDAGGVVYYANYLKFFERARTEMLRTKSLNQSELKEQRNIIFMVRKCQIEYKIPARLDDLITIKTKITSLSRISISMNQQMIRNQDQKLLNETDVELVCVNSTSMKPCRIPKDLSDIPN